MTNGHTNMVEHEENCNNCIELRRLQKDLGSDYNLCEDAISGIYFEIEKQINNCFSESLEGSDEDG